MFRPLTRTLNRDAFCESCTIVRIFRWGNGRRSHLAEHGSMPAELASNRSACCQGCVGVRLTIIEHVGQELATTPAGIFLTTPGDSARGLARCSRGETDGAHEPADAIRRPGDNLGRRRARIRETVLDLGRAACAEAQASRHPTDALEPRAARACVRAAGRARSRLGNRPPPARDRRRSPDAGHGRSGRGSARAAPGPAVAARRVPSRRRRARGRAPQAPRARHRPQGHQAQPRALRRDVGRRLAHRVRHRWEHPARGSARVRPKRSRERSRTWRRSRPAA